MGRSSAVLLAMLGWAGCVVGPQYDPLENQPTDEEGGRAAGFDDDSDATGVEGEAEQPPTYDTGPYPDDGSADPWAGEGDTDGEDGPDGDARSLDDLPVPLIPPVPRPGGPSPLPNDSPTDGADDQPDASPDCDGESNPRLPAD